MKIFNSELARGQPRLEMRHLAMLLAVAEAGSLSQAAQEMGLTPSALSHRLAEAERRVDARLFDRSGRAVTLTPAGETLWRMARKVVDMAAQAEGDVAWLAGSSQQTLRIGMAHYAAFDWLPDFLALWRTDYADSHLCVVADARQTCLEKLRNGLLDLALLPYRPSDLDLVASPLFEDELVLIAPPDLGFGTKGYIAGQDLAALDFLTYTRVVVPGQEYERLWKQGEGHPARLIDMELPEVIAELVAAGQGVSILSRWAMARWIAPGRVAAWRVSARGLPIAWHAVARKSRNEPGEVTLLRAALGRFFAGDGQGATETRL
ncbi:MAG: LysR family transcriptional regulator [Rhodospirillales bacterium]